MPAPTLIPYEVFLAEVQEQDLRALAVLAGGVPALLYVAQCAMERVMLSREPLPAPTE